MRWGILTIVLLQWLIVASVASMSDTPNVPLIPADAITSCEDKSDGNYEKITCWTEGEYVPPDSAINQAALDAHYGGVMPDDGLQPFTVVKRKTGGKKRLVSTSPGHAQWPTACKRPDLSHGDFWAGAVGVFVCPGHYPDQRVWGDGQNPDYGINFYNGNYERRYRLALLKAIDLHSNDIDMQAGVLRTGTSMGAVRSLAAMLNVEQELPRDQQFVSNLMTHFHLRVGITQPHKILERKPGVAVQLNGYDLDRVNFDRVAETGKLNHKYIRIECDTGDPLPFCDPAIFDQADKHGIASVGTWHGCGFHSVECEGYNFPYGKLYPNGGSGHRLDQPYVAFSSASSNHTGDAGHHNLGLRYDVDSVWAVDTALLASVLVMYERHENLGPDIPAMPQSSTVSVVIRNLQDFTLTAGESISWSLRDGLGVDQSGVVEVLEDDEIWIPNVTLPAGAGKAIVLTKTSEVPPADAPKPIPLVYTRIKAQNDPIPNTPIKSAGVFQSVTDVAKVNANFQAGASVVLNLMDGSDEVVIHDCTDLALKCTAQEARVSPDGKQIVYSVSYSNTLRQVQAWGFPVKLPIYDMGYLTKAELWLYTIATGERRRLTTGHIDRQPAWVDNRTLVLSSNRARQYTLKGQYTYHESADQCSWPCTQNQSHYGLNHHAMQIWKLDIETGDAWNLTPMEVMALSPTVISNGDVLFSSGQLWDQNTIGSTPLNEYWICRVQSNGADQTCVLNAHGSPQLHANKYLNENVFGDNFHAKDMFKGIRCMAEIDRLEVAGSNYYRGNHGGCFGQTYAFSYADPRVEGSAISRNIPAVQQYADQDKWGSGLFVPSTLRALFPGGQSQDAEVKYQKSAEGGRGSAYGKMGYPQAYPKDGQFLATWAQGECFLGAPALYPAAMGNPCLKVPVLQKVDMVTDPFNRDQVEVLIDDPEYHRWDVSAVTTYQKLFGQPIPDPLPPVDKETCTLQVVDARKAELYPLSNGKAVDDCKTMGCTIDPGTSYHEDNIHALTIYQLEHWDTRPDKTTMNNLGWKSISKIAETPLETDGSVYQSVPCGVPILTVATDSDGMVITRNDMAHGLTGGPQVCHGCHDGHSEERRVQISDTAEVRFADTLAYGKGPKPHSEPYRVSYADVKGTIEKCAQCHADMSDPAVKNPDTGDKYLYSWFAWDHKKITRPDQSKYVSKFSLESPGYIHCGNAVKHATGATPDECKLIGEWIDQGAQR